MRVSKAGWFFIAMLVLFVSHASAQVQLQIEAGWGGKVHEGRWNPVYLTLSSPTQREVSVEIFSPHSSDLAMKTQFGRYVIQSVPKVIPVYLPLSAQLGDTTVTLRDVETGKTVAQLPFDQSLKNGAYPTSYGTEKTWIGVSGKRPVMSVLDGWEWNESTTQPYYQRQALAVGYLASQRLPEVAIGYDALDVLVLNQPDLTSMTPKQQLAIADWVRAGGRLIIWLTDPNQPENSPVLEILPCDLGELEPSEISADVLKSLGLPRGLAKIPRRRLTPHPGASRINAVGSVGEVVYDRAGLGMVMVLAVDAGQFQFPDRDGAVKFWKPIFTAAVGGSLRTPGSDETPYYSRRGTGSDVLDHIGQIQGAGTFDFKYIAIVLIGMMFIVGPIDWLVLKKLGRQPWTWATTSGWIALITVGAIYIGHIFKSGELHYRTITLVDQVDDHVVANVDVALVYSPKTAYYHLESEPGAWWQPTAAEMSSRRSTSELSELPCEQDYRSNTIDQMLINVWNARCVRGDRIYTANEREPMLGANLSIRKSDGHLVGTITNLGKSPWREVYVYTGAGMATIVGSNQAYVAKETLPSATPSISSPTTTFTVDAELHAWTVMFHNRFREYVSTNPQPARSKLILPSGELAEGRSLRIEEILANHKDIACVCTESDDAVVDLKLNDSTAKEKHWLVLRALVPLH